ncbi:2OG-Fe(II) oxygenase [Nocardia asteroides NBRC 15531]|nr:2OG-Fe(II) oxygenase [Nocardia asteroides NBRC 15531]
MCAGGSSTRLFHRPYRAGHYLRRHSDTYEDRVFGLVFFISDSWQHRDGGQLVVEYPDGRVDVLDPEPATVVALPIAPGYWHMVAEVSDTDWVRHSVAAHFGVEPR